MTKYQDELQDKRICKLEEHFSIINEEMGGIKADVKWLKWFLPPISIISAIAAAILTYLLK